MLIVVVFVFAVNVRVDIMPLINVCVVSFQQIKREKALKDELVRELESKELEMQLLLQRQKSVSPYEIKYPFFVVVPIVQCLVY